MSAVHPPARAVLRAGGGEAIDRVVLDYADRLLRRRRLRTESGASVLVDLAETVSLDAGDALLCTDGTRIAVVAAEEDLVAVTAPAGGLARLAWHIGNRHTPCQIGARELVIQRDHVIEDMLARLGAELVPVRRPFTPEGGAYGTGRTMGHDHGHGHEHGHGHDHDHAHGHKHGHDHDHAPGTGAAGADDGR